MDPGNSWKFLAVLAFFQGLYGIIWDYMGFIWDYMGFIGVAPSHNRSWCGLGMGLHQAITKKT